MARARKPTGKQAKMKKMMGSVRRKVERGLLKKMGRTINQAVQALKTKPQTTVRYNVTYSVTGGP